MTKRKSLLLTLCMAFVMCLCLGFSFNSSTMTAHASSGTPVTELTVSGLTDADVPQIGKNATMPTLTLKESGLEISRVYWFCLNTREEPKATDKFESGYTYALRLQYSVLSGYEAQITEPSKIKLDGVITPYTVEIYTNGYMNFIFNGLGNEELSLVNPERLQLADGYVGAFATTDSICVKGGKFPYQFSNIQCPTWLPYNMTLHDGNIWKIAFYGNRPTTPTPAQVLSFTVTDADGNSKTFTGTTGETKENPGAIQDIVVKYNLPNVGAQSPTSEQLKSAITLPPNVVCTQARVFKTSGSISETSFTFEKWEEYTFSFKLETTNGKLFAGSSLLKGYLVSNNNFSYDTQFGNVSQNSLVLKFNVTKYGVTTEELDNYKMTTETLKHAKVGVLYNEKIEFTKPAGVADSDIKIKCLDTLYGGLSVNEDGTITGTPDDRVYYDYGKTITLRIRFVYKTYILDYKEYELVVEGYTQIYTPDGKTLKYNGSEQIGVEVGEGYTLTGTTKATDIGKYTAIAQLKPGYRWGAPGTYQYGQGDEEITWEIVKGEQSAPTGITTEQATVEGKNDGKILGVSTDMGYYDYSTSTWKDCIGDMIENLPAGRYGIYYKANANYNKSEETVVEITNKYEKTDFKITTATLPNGKCDVEYNAKIDVTCPTGDLSKVEIKNYSETGNKVYGLNIAKDGTISGKPDARYQNGKKNVEWIVVYYYDGILMADKTYFLDIDGYTVLSFVSGNQNLIYDGSEQIGVSEGEGYTLTGTIKATDAGNYVATAKLKPGYRWDTTSTEKQFANHNINWSIAKADKDAPVGVKGFNTSNVGVNDGKITGVTTDMEYRVVGGSGTFADCTGAEITGLAKGQYEVRYKESKNYKASAHVTITIAENEVITYMVTVTKGTGGGEYEEGVSVTLTANTPGAGERFTGWTLTGVSVADTTQTEITFNMPANAVTATANYEDIEYSITVNGGTADKAKAKYGETIKITATVPTGKKFVEWTSESGIIFADKINATTTFSMPAGDVTVVAKIEDEIYRITVTNGTATPEMAKYQTEVTVKANEPATDMYFDKWEVTGLDTTDMDLTKTEIKFNMPAGNVTFEAKYLSVPKYDIIMVDGTKDISPAKAGETITITANGAPTGKVFDKWTCETAGVTIEFASATSSTTTFVMPACEITIQAHFRDVGTTPSVEIKVKGGTGAGVVKQGDTVTVIANAPAEGKRFKHWENASGEILSTKATYEFSVRENITLTAVYEDIETNPTPDKAKQGLSGGQIAGIVIGTLLLAGIGGFAIFWFAVKKKTFADIGIAFKKFFEKIKNLFKKKK